LTLDNGKTATVNLEVENKSENSSENTWKIEALSDLSSNCEYTDGKLNILILEDLEFYYFDDGWYRAVKSNYGDMKEYLDIIIVINGTRYIPDEIVKIGSHYFATLNDISEKPSSYTIIYEIGPAQSAFCDRFAVTVQNQ
ncbi:MAG: hypothetical protein ACI3XL_02285, partial [Eubacteriales bacterium]